MGFQFIHVESYARKPDSKGRSVGFILDEVSRKPGASEHVKSPGEHTVVYGIGVEELRAFHDSRVAEATTVNAAGKAKKIRVDQHTMMTVVASNPAEAMSDDVERWQSKTVEWLKEKYGAQLQSVVRHDDEAYPHLHAYILPDDREVKARRLHDGVVAKTEAKEKALANGHDAKAANKIGDDAYKAAMRSLQDDYFEKVGLSSGLARLGPGRRRLDRGAWKAEQAQVKHAAVAIAAAEKADQSVSMATSVRVAEEDLARVTKENAAKAVERARAAADRAKAQADSAEARKTEAEKAAEISRRDAAQHVRQAKRQAAEIRASAQAELHRLKSWGGRLGSIWVSLAGVRGRIEKATERRVAEIEAKAAEKVKASEAEVLRIKSLASSKIKTADKRAEERVGRELVQARKLAEKVGKLELGLGQERSARISAETERERFRALWADADNRLIDLKRGRNYGR